MIQGDQEVLRHPQRPHQAQPRRVQQVPVMFIKNWHDTCLYAIFQRQVDLKQSQRDTGWSRGSRTPSATSTSSTKASTASTSYVHQKLAWHMFICYFSKTNRFKTVPAWCRVIKRLSDTLSDLVKLNHGEFRKYYIVIFIIKLTYIQFLNINRFRMVPRWSWWSHRKKCVFLNAYI